MDATNFASGDPNQIPNQLTIATGRLLIEEGGFITAATFSNRSGANIQIIGADSVELRSTPPDTVFPTGIFSNTIFGTGKAGNIEIQTRELKLVDGAQISTRSGAGSLRIPPIPFGGEAGNLLVRATERVEITGFVDDFPSALLSGTLSSFPAGDLTVVTGELIISDGARITVDSNASGDSGNLQVLADFIALDKNASITANTFSGAGGNIQLEAEHIQIRRQSQISTNAGNGDGGNIAINTNTLVALENSDITANADLGFGGRVTIDGNLFGIENRNQLTEQSDITATSELGPAFTGAVTVNNPEVDPGNGLIELSSDIIDPSKNIIVSCAATGENSFTITGAGGLPQDPKDRLLGSTLWQDWQDFSIYVPEEVKTESPAQISNLPSTLPQASGWIVNTEGNIELVTRSSFVSRLPQCN